jgi:hypothetical protein
MAFQELLETYGLDPDIFDVIHKIPALPTYKPQEPEFFMIPVPRTNAVFYANGNTLVH